MSPFVEALDELSDRKILLFGGKGGVGKTTLSAAAALHFAKRGPVILFTTDPASNIGDLLGDGAVANLSVETLETEALYARFLSTHLEQFVEIGDRGTYLDRDELRHLLELALPGADELMAWMHIGELAEEHPDSLLVVDTAPTGHTLRMLSSSGHFRQVALALDAMQEKHRAMVRQFARRSVHDAMDEFIEQFDARAARRREMLTDRSRTAFVPVLLSEPLVVTQTLQLVEELAGFDVPFVVLNRAHEECRAGEDVAARERLAPLRVVDAPRACVPLDSAERLEAWTDGTPEQASAAVSAPAALNDSEPIVVPRMLFLAGKGGVGKTSCAASIALQLAALHPDRRFVAISVDPAHSLRDLFAGIDAPRNLAVEIIDTKGKWERFRESYGARIEQTVDALTPRGMSIGYDAEAMRRVIELAPPGADELFAITRLSDLASDAAVAGVIVDTAPTGHFLRLLDLPRQAGQWVHEFMRLLLRYRDMIPAGSLGEELVRASRALRELEAFLRSDRAGVIAVTRPERIVVAETRRLIEHVRGRGLGVAGVIANYVTPRNDCRCDQSMRAHELTLLCELGSPLVIERQDASPMTAEELAGLV